ncbi:hypothetical protein QWY31_08125 [Cytophagales bacterium LB-30]|uniref:Uncharacterized protein n=1 Tax=Shiella aurantiaca TaxID=3058365 RepID=A0ABT8F4S0_9BACT|nr:hypothetical protein [Shiella aurantiaca]MDN4165463.1 hypothetical protein [Shiella aurantiaca]
MKIRCIYKTGEALRSYEYTSLEKDVLGRFGVTGYSEYGELEIGKEYLVMGTIAFKSHLAYLIDDKGLISVCPCQLFEVIDSRVNPNWYFRLVEKDEHIYPFIQGIWGYHELCFDKKSYENLIVEREEEAQRIYFRRKIELEESLEQI